MIPRSFDLSNESVKRILRDVAATQYAAPGLTEVKQPEPKPIKTVQFLPPLKPPAKSTPKVNLPDWPKGEDGSFSTWLVDEIFETLVEEVFNVDHDETVELSRVGWVECQASIDLKRESLGNGSCKD